MIVVDYKLTGIELLTRMQVVNAVKRALRRMGEYWHEAFAWKRFTAEGGQEYGFKPRRYTYDNKKRKYFGEALPLVFRGDTRDELLSENTKARIRVTRDTVRIPMPTRINQFVSRYGIKPADEIKRVSRAELDVLQENLVVWIEGELNSEVPAHLRNQGFTGGSVKRLSIKTFRGKRNANPVERRKAA